MGVAVITSTRSGLTQDIAILLIAILRYVGGTDFQGAHSSANPGKFNEQFI